MLEDPGGSPLTAERGPLPEFIGIGAQRAGTTWLHECLRTHPQVFVPLHKETQFFNLHFERGLDEYRMSFCGAKPEAVVGEITPNYHHDEKALQRIREALPGAFTDNRKVAGRNVR